MLLNGRVCRPYCTKVSMSISMSSILDEIIEIMIEVYVMKADIKVSGKVIPYQLVRHRLDCYDQMLMEYVLFSLQDNSSKVGNIKQYLLATIINAPATEKKWYRNIRKGKALPY